MRNPIIPIQAARMAGIPHQTTQTNMITPPMIRGIRMYFGSHAHRADRQIRIRVIFDPETTNKWLMPVDWARSCISFVSLEVSQKIIPARKLLVSGGNIARIFA